MRGLCPQMFATLSLSLCMFCGSLEAAEARAAMSPPDYVQSRIISERAEQMIETGGGLKRILECCRDTFVKWRAQCSIAQNENKSQINTLKSQLAALGSEADDGNEPAKLQERRAELWTRIHGF